ncbi:MAG TPA: methyltransferase domain-containing protein [Gemmatimonas aurantiaca]|uniref:Methyltransferase type 11 domain-containing protein n=2 Tax=Gemmatimonas aurantiaca TaxID=173480 RepID=C1AA33_GEMAT|nr:methyltransferase domain-containing protein [Gemmatimonas aurantiaca]BAH39631.1 hypothetical protein GAU_2589 [Gemmatimonas aurantiaca T-27]HCT58360.1 methyltransferase domain-containing protein [Gemmatimonas aurantiaca]
MLTPSKRRGEELLDDPAVDGGLALRSLRDVALANLFFGGRLVVLRAFGPLFEEWSRAPQSTPRTLLDLGTGLGDIPAAVVRAAHRRGIAMRALGLERTPLLARTAGAQCHAALVGDAMQLPLADASVDVVMCSQVLHHFDGAPADQLLRECTRVARHAVIVADLRRSWLAVGGLWSGSFLLGFHPVSRHDGMLSVLRGYTASELGTLVRRATGCTPLVRASLGFRLSATWRPPHSPRPA